MPTKILLIEHNPDHILLTKKIIQKDNENFQIDAVDDAEEGIEKIVIELYDMVLSDYRLPGMSALEILRKIKANGIDIPFVVVTSAGNEKIAVDLMREGAYDYVVKDAFYHDILPVVVNRTLERHGIKKAKESAEAALRDSERRYRLLAENATDVIWTCDLDLHWEYFSPSIEHLVGYSVEEYVKLTLSQMLTPLSLERAEKFLREGSKKDINAEVGFYRANVVELEFLRKDGTPIWVEVNTTVLRTENNDPIGIIGITRDISQRKKAQEDRCYL